MKKSEAIAPALDPGSGRLPADQRREQLIQVAVDLFSRKGFKGTTTREIAKTAGVTEAIIFRHFATKEQLYTAIIDRKINSPATAGWLAGLRQAMDHNDDRAVIEKLITAIIETNKIDPKFERLMLYAALEGNDIALLYIRQLTESIVDAFRKYLERRQMQGRIRPMNPDTALTAIVGMAEHFAHNKYVHEMKEHCLSDADAVEAFTRVAMHGIVIPVSEAKAKSVKKK